MLVNGIEIEMEFDPGAGASIILQKVYDSLFSNYRIR